VVALKLPDDAAHGHGVQLVTRLLEVGFVPGEVIDVRAVGPGGVEPLAVRVGGTQFALRRHEAEHILVESL
jgi:ferrous iron transport protein A